MKRPNLGMAPIKTEVSVEAYREIMRLEKTIEQLRDALICVVAYWDEWKDAPDNHPTALSLEEVVNIARTTLEGRDP